MWSIFFFSVASFAIIYGVVSVYEGLTKNTFSKIATGTLFFFVGLLFILSKMLHFPLNLNTVFSGLLFAIASIFLLLYIASGKKNYVAFSLVSLGLFGFFFYYLSDFDYDIYYAIKTYSNLIWPILLVVAGIGLLLGINEKD